MSEIITNKLTGKTAAGDVTITSEGGAATMTLQDGVAKIVAIVDSNTATTETNNSTNVSSVTDNGTAYYKLSWTNNMDSLPYAFAEGSNSFRDNYIRFSQVVTAAGSHPNTPSTMKTNESTFQGGYVIHSASGQFGYGYFVHIAYGDMA